MMHRREAAVFLGLSCLLALPAQAQEFHVQPYLQDIHPTSAVIMWETSHGAESIVEWGPTEALGQTSSGEAGLSAGSARIHTVEISGLEANQSYHYRVRTEAAVSEIHRFRTPSERPDEAATRLVAMSDMQRDSRQPQMFREVVNEGVISHIRAQHGAELSDHVDLVMIAGDLVDNGQRIDEWRETFFAPAAELFAEVPLYPVPGNHERDSPRFFSYFHLPENGSFGLEEHWWWIDRSNVRIIGLDSNNGYRTQQQLDWLTELLAETCEDPLTDFVFAQLHHPFESELWIAGNTSFTGEVIERLETFSTECDKPSVHFFGHTHGYSRGQSRDHNHTMMNVATAGGKIDGWGEYAQQDYPEFVMTTADYGFVVADIIAGDEAAFTLRRYSRGRPGAIRDNEETDRLTIRRHNEAPQQPTAWAHSEAVRPDCLTLQGSPYRDPDGDGHGSTHWQIAKACDDFDPPAFESWKQSMNLYFETDDQANDLLEDEVFEGLDENTNYCWRLRYRDEGLAWSAWSEPVTFTTTAAPGGPNLVVNGDAEGGTEGWTVVAGYFESVTDGECDGIEPHSGERYFAVGGVCDAADEAEAYQDVDLSDRSDAVYAGDLHARLSAWLSDFNGNDEVRVDLQFLAGDGTLLSTSNALTRRARGWQRMGLTTPIPAMTRSIRVRLQGTRHAGSDNDAYVDDIALHLVQAGDAGCAPAPPPPESPPEPPTGSDAGPSEPPAADGGISTDAGAGLPPESGCGCQNAPAREIGLLFLLAMLLRRRKTPAVARVGRKSLAAQPKRR
ncbi:MAG: hypothetical protein CMH55_06375 [Myxococcales bacterium]|nr:hypothetical protein [Myxococcales bacterium]